MRCNTFAPRDSRHLVTGRVMVSQVAGKDDCFAAEGGIGGLGQRHVLYIQFGTQIVSMRRFSALTVEESCRVVTDRHPDGDDIAQLGMGIADQVEVAPFGSIVVAFDEPVHLLFAKRRGIVGTLPTTSRPWFHHLSDAGRMD